MKNSEYLYEINQKNYTNIFPTLVFKGTDSFPDNKQWYLIVKSSDFVLLTVHADPFWGRTAHFIDFKETHIFVAYTIAIVSMIMQFLSLLPSFSQGVLFNSSDTESHYN